MTRPKLGLWDKISSSSKQKKIGISRKLFEDALNNWRRETEDLKSMHEKELEVLEGQLRVWEEKKQDFELEKKEKNDAIKKKKEQYLAGQSESVSENSQVCRFQNVFLCNL